MHVLNSDFLCALHGARGQFPFFNTNTRVIHIDCIESCQNIHKVICLCDGVSPAIHGLLDAKELMLCGLEALNDVDKRFRYEVKAAPWSDAEIGKKLVP